MRRGAAWLVVGGLLLGILMVAGPLSAAEKGDAEKGKAQYQTFCAVCHGASGKGDGPTAAALNPRPRDHTDGKYMNTLKNEYLTKVVKQGGPAVGKSPLMPPWGASLNDEQILNVIAYVRSLAVPAYKGE